MNTVIDSVMSVAELGLIVCAVFMGVLAIGYLIDRIRVKDLACVRCGIVIIVCFIPSALLLMVILVPVIVLVLVVLVVLLVLVVKKECEYSKSINITLGSCRRS